MNHTGANSTKFKLLRLWLPDGGKDPHVFRLTHELEQLTCFPTNATLQGDSRGGFVVNCDPLPRSYAVVEVQMASGDDEVESLWGFLKIKPDVFDISGGWIASDINGRNSLTIDEYVLTLSKMHVNTGQIEEVPGYTDNQERYNRFPFKRFNRMQDLSRYDTEELLPTIHAVEFIGEPQYGGGRPIPPQEVWKLLAPYHSSRLPTSVTLSEERTWLYYAGLSDYPHYDAYRVIAPAAASALRFIREHACQPITAEDVAAHLAVSRSTLDRCLHAAVGHSATAAIMQARLASVKSDLAETDLSLQAIASRAGFASVQHLANLFRERVGMTAGRYRRDMRH